MYEKYGEFSQNRFEQRMPTIIASLHHDCGISMARMTEDQAGWSGWSYVLWLWKYDTVFLKIYVSASVFLYYSPSPLEVIEILRLS